MNPTSTPPLVLLDVDGVLNALANDGDLDVWPHWQNRTVTTDRDLRILWSPTVVSAIQRWISTGRADVRWLTTWRDDANRVLGANLGLPRLPVLGPDGLLPPCRTIPPARPELSGQASRDALAGAWWKADEVFAITDAEPQRPVLWIDDDLEFEHVLRSVLQTTSNVKFLAPPPQFGLTPELLAEADRWLTAHQPERRS